MRFKTKTYLFFTTFFIFILVYFLLQLLYPQNHLVQHHLIKAFDVFNQPAANFIAIMILFVLLALCITKLFEFVYIDIKGSSAGKPRLGKCLLYEKLITEEDLEGALAEQRFKIGEMLIKGRRVTKEQLEDALSRQKGSKKRLGEILLELGYIEKKDIQWALQKMGRRLGDILKDNHCVSEYDLQCVLAYQYYRQRVEK